MPTLSTPRTAALVGACTLAGMASFAGSAAAADEKPCGPTTSRTVGTVITTQNCPVLVPTDPGWGFIPVQAFDAKGANPKTVGRINHGGSVNWFLCQRRGPVGAYRADRNDWWALTLSDDDRRGWSNEIFFDGGGNMEPDGKLRVCGEADLAWARAGGAGVPGSTAPQPPPPPVPPPSHTAPPEPLRVGLYYTYKRYPHSSRMQFVSLRARKVAPEARIELRCRGKGCRFKKRTVKRKGSSTSQSLTRSVRRLRLRRGSVLDVRFTAPGRTGRLRHLKVVKRGKIHEGSTCLDPASGKPQRCPR